MGKKNKSSNHDNQTENTPDLEKCVKKMVAEAVNLWKTEYFHEINALKVELKVVKNLYVASMKVQTVNMRNYSRQIESKNLKSYL